MTFFEEFFPLDPSFAISRHNHQTPGAQKGFVGFQIIRMPAEQPFLLAGLERHREFGNDTPGHVILNGEHVFQFAVVVLRP